MRVALDGETIYSTRKFNISPKIPYVLILRILFRSRRGSHISSNIFILYLHIERTQKSILNEKYLLVYFVVDCDKHL